LLVFLEGCLVLGNGVRALLLFLLCFLVVVVAVVADFFENDANMLFSLFCLSLLFLSWLDVILNSQSMLVGQPARSNLRGVDGPQFICISPFMTDEGTLNSY
jgi:hypothetical protein